MPIDLSHVMVLETGRKEEPYVHTLRMHTNIAGDDIKCFSLMRKYKIVHNVHLTTFD